MEPVSRIEGMGELRETRLLLVAARARIESAIAAVDATLVAEELVRLRESLPVAPPELRVVGGG